MGKRNVFKDFSSAFDSEWLWKNRELSLDSRLFKHTKYYDKVCEDTRIASPDIPSGGDLENDLFILLYSGRNDINLNADWLYRKMAEEIRKSKGFLNLKSLCESKELFALTAAASIFHTLTEQIIPALLSDDNMRKYIEIAEMLQPKISADFIYIQSNRNTIKNGSPEEQKKFLKTANRLHDRQTQRDNLLQKLEECYLRNSKISGLMENAVQHASEEVNELYYTLLSWSEDTGTVGNIPFDSKLLERIKQDSQLQNISKLLGKYKEMLIDKRKNSFSYGEGEKYDLTTGNDINSCLSSDIALLSSSETRPLFMHKYMNKGLTQYRKREAVTKAKGDIIACVDGSGSMSDRIAWAMSVALALQEIAAKDKRKFALIQFGNKEQIHIDEFIPGAYTQNDTMEAAVHFFGGGTNFEQPLQEAMQLMESGYHDAEIAFITDGNCEISEEFAEKFAAFKDTHKLTITGILIDDSDENCGDSLKPFCDRIYRTTSMNTDDIAEDLLTRIDEER